MGKAAALDCSLSENGQFFWNRLGLEIGGRVRDRMSVVLDFRVVVEQSAYNACYDQTEAEQVKSVSSEKSSCV